MPRQQGETAVSDAPGVAWFHCFSGIAGDMAMGALVDAGADLAEIRALCERIPVGGWQIDAEAVTRGGLGATKVEVAVEETSVVRTAAHIVGLVEEARLPERVRKRALATFGALAEAEGRVHRHPPEQVHFHEIGGIDAIIEVVGTCAGLEILEVDEVCASPLTTGLGTHASAHGTLPHPSPAVVELLRDVPVQGTEQPFELVTPTGAALLVALATEWGALQAMTIAASGFGAGSRELDDRPNVTQVVLGHRREELDRGQPVMLLESNVDDVTGDAIPDVVNVDRSKAQLVIRVGKGDGTCADPVFIDTGERRDYLYNPVIADFNRDGRNDVAVAKHGKGKILVHLAPTPE